MYLSRKKVGVLELYTHGVRIIATDDRVKVACRRILTDWVVYGERKVENAQGELVNEQYVAQLYGATFKGGSEFWLHKGQLKSLEAELQVFDVNVDDFEIRVIPVHTPSKQVFNLKPGRVMRDYQNEAKEFALRDVINGDHFSKLVAMPTGTGKAQPDSEPTLTPSGWQEIGTICVGDEVLTANGSITAVTGVYPQGVKEVFRVTFEDGRYTRAVLDHLWKVHDTEWETLTTAEMIERLKEAQGQLHVPLYTPISGIDRELPMPAYQYGCEYDGQETIPEDYMLASLAQRFELANGITKAWGISSEAEVILTFDHISVAEQVASLFRSLGKIASVSKNKVKGEKRIRFSVTVTSPKNSLKGKRKGILGLKKGFSSPGLGITSIEFDGFEDCTCISVEHPSHLYISREYVVTHNTVTLCGIASENRERLMVGILPKYSDKWGKDLADNLDINPKQIMIIEKTTQLRGVIDMCKTQGAKKLPPLVVIALTTLRMFYDKYAEDPDGCVEDMGCAPWELGKLLDIGIFAIDEAHEHIHTVFRTAMYLHGVKFIALSGTMRTEDDFQERVQNTIFPQIKRFLKVKMEQYIDVEFIGYNIDHSFLPKIRYTAFGRTDYNHPTLEKSFMKIPVVLQSYLQMVTELLDHDYIPRAKGHRALVFVGTVELADKMISEFKQRYPQLTIARYCAAQGDKYADLLKADLTVSTLQSAGTAVDIPDLVTVICTTMVNSSKSNLQVLGRLRKLLSGQRVSMFMPYCKQIPKHIKYTAFRFELFKDIVKSIKTFNYTSMLGRRY